MGRNHVVIQAPYLIVLNSHNGFVNKFVFVTVASGKDDGVNVLILSITESDSIIGEGSDIMPDLNTTSHDSMWKLIIDCRVSLQGTTTDREYN